MSENGTVIPHLTAKDFPSEARREGGNPPCPAQPKPPDSDAEPLCADFQRPEHPGSYTLVCACLFVFLAEVCRCCFDTPEFLREDVTESGKINGILEYINENLASDLSLDRIASRFYISKFYLSKPFKRFTGMSIYQYIIKKRVSISGEMLRNGATVTAAYLDGGFQDYSNYLKAFKREFHCNPREYVNLRREAREVSQE